MSAAYLTTVRHLYMSLGLFFCTKLLTVAPGFMFMVKLMVHLFPMKSTNILLQLLNIELSQS